MSQKTTDLLRVRITSGCLIGVFSLAAVTQARLQVFQRDETIEKAKKTNRFSFRHIDYARRGSILAADGKALAQDQEVYELNVEFDKVPHADGFYLDLAAASGVPASEFATLATTLTPGHAHRNWRRAIAPSQAKQINEVRGKWRADGLSVRRIERRSYPMGVAASGIVGEVKEGVALSGLEAGVDRSLRGKNGEQVGLTDRFGEFLPLADRGASSEKHDGRDVQLTIDRDLQNVAATAVRHAVENSHADQGVAIVIDPKTGDILAMANWPSFEPYAADGGDGDRQKNSGFNLNVRGALEPGSMFKVLSLAIAMDTGRVTMNTVTNCSGEYHPSPSTMIRCDDHHGRRAHNAVTPEDAIARSCNVSAAMWAAMVGRDRYLEYIDKLGLTEPTKIGFTREAVGGYNEDDPAWRLQLANMAFGQSITCTPIALASAFATLANGGVRIPPRLIKRDGDEERPSRPGVRVFSEKAAADVMRCMEAVFDRTYGTAHELRIPGYELAGKTGTAQKGNRSVNGYVSNFVGVVPAKDPKAVVMVMVDHPQGAKYYGAQIAGPAFDQIAHAVIRRYSLPPTVPVTPASTVAAKLHARVAAPVKAKRATRPPVVRRASASEVKVAVRPARKAISKRIEAAHKAKAAAKVKPKRAVKPAHAAKPKPPTKAKLRKRPVKPKRVAVDVD